MNIREFSECKFHNASVGDIVYASCTLFALPSVAKFPQIDNLLREDF